MIERDLDAVIEAVLKTDTVVTARQKRQAWERLQQRAAQQTIWPPLVEPETSLTGTLQFALARARRCLTILLIDEGFYERARRERLAFHFCATGSSNPPPTLLELAPYPRSQV